MQTVYHAATAAHKVALEMLVLDIIEQSGGRAGVLFFGEQRNGSDFPITLEQSVVNEDSR